MTEQELIDHVAIMESLRRVIAAAGDGYVDPNAATGEDCRYVSISGDQPVCIAAQALHDAGVPLHDLKRWEGEAAYAMAPGARRINPDPDRRDLVTHEAARILSFAQNYNDDAMPWDLILSHVERALPLIVRGDL